MFFGDLRSSCLGRLPILQMEEGTFSHDEKDGTPTVFRHTVAKDDA